MRSDDGPPDFPGAVGATDLELVGLGRGTGSRSMGDARDDAFRVLVLGPTGAR